MANYRAIIRQFPCVVDYLRHATKWVRRGDVLAYPALVRTSSFSTDAFGFRHTYFEGREIGIGDIHAYPRIGLVLGSSHVFGFGLSHNSETLPSRLSELLGYPFVGIVFPEADTRTLHAVLARITRQFAERIQHVILIAGGDFTRFCFSGIADPLFGSPMLPQESSVDMVADEPRQVANILQFSLFWTASCIETAAQSGVRLTLADDLTFFEKSAPDALEQTCQLGIAHAPSQRKRFENHVRHRSNLHAQRRQCVSTRGWVFAQFPDPDKLLYVDEYHYRVESQRLIAQVLAEQLIAQGKEFAV